MNMLGILNDIKSNFPRATIVLLNYYRVVSDKSSPFGAYAQSQLQRQLRKRLKTFTEYKGTNTQLIEENLQKQTWATNSDHFLRTSQACFAWAIACVNGTNGNVSCALDNPKDDRTVPSTVQPCRLLLLVW